MKSKDLFINLYTITYFRVFAITEYTDEKKSCYLGFFECIKDNKVAKEIFKEAESFAKTHKYKKIQW